MSLLRHLGRGFRVLTHRDESDRAIADELGHFADLSAAEHVRRGMGAEAARRAASVEMGNMTVAREQVRSYGWENAISTLAADVRYGTRRLVRSPAFTIVSIVTLALGIGASTAIFSAVNPVLFRSLPYPHADRLTSISDRGGDGSVIPVTFGTYREIEGRSRSFATMAPFKAWQPTLVAGPEPERLTGQSVGASYFRTLGIAPAIGRDFRAEDDRPDGPREVILSDRLWRTRFSADASLVGRAIKLDDIDYSVVGVMPRDFTNVLAPNADAWTMLRYASAFGPDSREWGHHLDLIARLQPGVQPEQAARELAQIARTRIPQFARVPWASLANGLEVAELQAAVSRGVRPALLAILGGVLVLLVMAGVNVTNLSLARGAQRQSEMAMRTALGASRGRLIAQLLTESTLLGAVGGGLGTLVAHIGVRALVALSPPQLPRVDAVRVDGAALVFALVVTAAISMLVGLVPALQAGHGDLRHSMQQGGRGSVGARQRIRGALVVAEVSLAVVLLAGAGLLLRSISRVFAEPVGFDQSGLVSMQVPVIGTRFSADSAKARFYAAALEAVSSIPGVTGAAFTALLPLSGDVDIYGVHLQSDAAANSDGAALRYAVSPAYFQVMRIPLRRGRLLAPTDRPEATRVVVVNESFARRAFPNRAAIGQRLRFGPAEGDWYTIVGVVGDVKQSALDAQQSEQIYVPMLQWHWVDNVMSLVVRARTDPAALTPAIRDAIRSVDRNLPLVRIATMRILVNRSVADRRFALILFGAFGLTALVLAATGIYGLVSGGVTERFREIGVRAALGALPSDILRLVLRQGMVLTLRGLGLGLVAAILASRAVASMLFGVSRLDPVTYFGVVSMLSAVAAIACILPAVRASRVDPAISLREQ